MKIAITGKGGVGKTTLAGVLSLIFSQEGHRVLAVDADPDANLASALGVSPNEFEKVVPLAEMVDLIQERTGAKPGGMGAMFKLNPKVDDIPDKYSIVFNGIRLLIMGKSSKKGGSGCYCPENILLKRLMRHLLVEKDEVVILDMEAGIEHLSRGTADSVEAFIVVVEPGTRSIQTAYNIKKLANDIGIKKILVVGNKVRSATDKEFILSHLAEFEVIGFVPFDQKVVQADIDGKSPFQISELVVDEVKKIKGVLEKEVGE